MSKDTNKHIAKVYCSECKGRGKKGKKIRKKIKVEYQRLLDQFEKSNGEGRLPVLPKRQLIPCPNCKGTGLISSDLPLEVNHEYPHIAIVGAGIGGVALAVACLHRGIPFTLYERDDSFDSRAQGYGLTLQQASKILKEFGIDSLDKGIVSTKHIVHTESGEVIGEWGMRKWLGSELNYRPKKTNIHISRQSLRLTFLDQLGSKVSWGHHLIKIDYRDEGKVNLEFNVGGKIKKTQADLVVGADGIRSSVRRLLIGEEVTPLRYLGCIVILGICSLGDLESRDHSLLDLATVFQTSNGNERIYVMPYDEESVMWQLSFPMDEPEAQSLSSKGAMALKEEACRRVDWHDPIPQLLSATKEEFISGYPVYDREILRSEMLNKTKGITLIGDAAHPMSPFKGQGANQALLDALSLARNIFSGCNSFSNWKEVGIRESILTEFETEMIKRTTIKVKDSAKAVDFLHSDQILKKGNEPRGREKSENK